MTHSLIESVPGFMRQAVRFLLPVDCAACHSPLTGDPIPHFCSGCWRTIASFNPSRCGRCDYPFLSPVATSHSPNHVCRSCRERPPSYTKAWTLYPYLPPLQDAICLLKYRGKVALAAPLARLMIDRLPRLESIDVIIPVPLHVRRLREREFNQSLLLADRIGRDLGIPVSGNDLIRIAPSAAQTTLSRKERQKNLRGAFAVPHPGAIVGKDILLIDDVFTTGATMNECAKTLRKAGSGDVFTLALARTVDPSHIPDRLLAQRDRAAPGFLGG
jgi:ComF family protein